MPMMSLYEVADGLTASTTPTEKVQNASEKPRRKKGLLNQYWKKPSRHWDSIPNPWEQKKGPKRGLALKAKRLIRD